jgi:tetratricopeptide (TPR) repeat protein
VRASSKTSAADLLWAEALNVEADLEAKLNKDAEALALALKAKEAALSLTRTNPNAQEPLQALYDASIRVGNALSGLGTAHYQEALQEYNGAIVVARKIASLGGDDKGDDDVIDAHMKIGDIYRDKDNQFSEARKEYQVGLATCLAALTKHPDSFNLLRDKGKAFFRIAELLRTEKTEGTLDEARAFYRQASEVQDALITRNAKEAVASPKTLDLTLKSNLAATDTHWGMLEKEAGRLDLALPKFERGAALNEELVKAEPGNPQWVDYVAPSYRFMGETLEGLKRPDEALTYYRKFADTRRMLAYRAPRGPNAQKQAQKEFADAAKLLGDRSEGLNQIEAYREAVRTWKRLVEDPRIADVAADQYDVVLGFAHVFDAKGDWPDAQAAYRVAKKVAVLNLVKDPSNTSWRDKAEIAERASVQAGKAAETAPADTPH